MGNWYPNNTTFATSYLTAQHEKQATTTATNSPVSVSWVIPSNTSNGNFATFSGDTAAHISADWANTGWGFSIDVTAAGINTILQPCVRRFNTDLSTSRAVDGLITFIVMGSVTGTGISAEANIDLSFWNGTPDFNTDASRAASDVVSFFMRASNQNMMATETLTISVIDTDTFLTHPNNTVVVPTIATSSTLFNPRIATVRNYSADEFYATNNDELLGGIGYDYEKELEQLGSAPASDHITSHTATLTSTFTENTHFYTTASVNVPTALQTTDWPTTDWYTGIELYTEVDLTLFSFSMRRMSTAGGIFDTRTVDTTNLSAGYHILEFGPLSWTTVNDWSGRTATDLVQIAVTARQSSGSDQPFAVYYNTTNTFIYNDAFSVTTPTIVCPVISASSSLFNPTIINTQEINLDVLAVPGSILSPSTQSTSTVELDVLNAASTVNAPSIVLRLFAPVINAPETVFTPNIVAKLLMDVLNTTSTIFSPSNDHRFLISMQSLSTTSTLFSPTVNSDIALNVVNSTTTVFNLSLDYDVVLPVINAPDNVLQPATDTSVNIELLFVADDSTIFSPTLNQDVALDVYNAPATVPNPQASNAGSLQDIQLVLVNASSTVFNPDITTLTTVTANVVNAPSTVNSPSLKFDVTVPVVTTVSTIFSPSLEQIVQLQLINTAPSVHAPRIGEAVDDGSTSAIINRPGFPPFPIGIS